MRRERGEGRGELKRKEMGIKDEGGKCKHEGTLQQN